MTQSRLSRPRQFGTAVELKALAPEDKEYEARYSKLTGLTVRVKPSGTKTFLFIYKLGKAPRRRIRIGTYPTTSLANAAAIAQGYRADVDRRVCPWSRIKADRAADAVQKATEEVEQREGTLADLLSLYVAEKHRQGQRSAPTVEGMLIRDVYDHDIAQLKARDVTASDIADLIGGIADRAPVVANRVRSAISAAYQFGFTLNAHHHWRSRTDKTFSLIANPVKAMPPRDREAPRTRVISEGEIRDLWLNGIGGDDDDAGIAMKLLIATGQRVEEVLGARISEFDFDAMTWTIPAARRKAKFDHIVPLEPMHRKLVEQAMRISHSGELLFPHRHSPRQPKPSQSLSTIVKRYNDVRGISPNFTPKDCRRTFKTHAGKLGLSLEIRNRLQGHALSDVGSVHYDQYDYLPEKRAAMRTYVAWLHSVIDGGATIRHIHQQLA